MNIHGILRPRANLVIASVLLTLITLGFLIIALKPIILNRECRNPRVEYENSLKDMAFQEEIAKKRWNTFYRYEAGEVWPDARKKTIDSSRFYGDFNDYWESDYQANYLAEERISGRIVVNNPKCFDSRLVSEMQEYLS